MEGPGSMAGGDVGPVKGITACLQKLDSQGENTQPDKTFTDHKQSQPQPEHQQAMDDFLEQIFNMPGWPDVGAAGKAPWECSSMALDSSQNNQKLFTKSLMGSGQGMMADLSLEDPLLASRLQQQLPNENLLGPSESTRSMALQLGSEGLNARPSQLLVSIGSPGILAVIRSPSSGSAAAAAVDTITIQSPTQSWRPPYVGLNPVPLSLGQGRVDTGRLLGKRLRDNDEPALTRPANKGLFTNFVRGGVAMGSTNEQAGQQSTHELALAQPQPQSSPPPGVVATPAPARPRVRARRGQATDPHSIAERQRRERIAERMKALQELVPNCNKTDKAAMLDEIIEYVKFLQLQVKVLSMSRLGGAGAVGPLVADISADASTSMQQLAKNKKGPENICRDDEGLSITEGEVAKLMNENMGSAMQYLQNKGLCLMPLSLAVTISGRSMQPNAVRSPCASNSPQPSESKSRDKEGTA